MVIPSSPLPKGESKSSVRFSIPAGTETPFCFNISEEEDAPSAGTISKNFFAASKNEAKAVSKPKVMLG
ncbi:Uncharacterised protein [Segatella copri]|nr:Uncharacterised protein [Segatella copri]